MWESIKNFFKNPWVQTGVAIAAVGGAIAATVAYLNDFTRPPIPPRGTPRDYSSDLQRLDPNRPIGVLSFNVSPQMHYPIIESAEEAGINASRNNWIAEMRRHYGDNIIIIDNAPIGELQNFATQFNARFGASSPEVHFVANHHHPYTYDDRNLAAFLNSIQASRKRALILACGSNSQAYRNSGCDYVIIPAPDGQGLDAELSLRISPAYREAIGWMRENANPEAVRQRFAERNIYNVTLEWEHRLGAALEGHPYMPPVVVTPPTNIPNRSGQTNTNTP